MIKKDYRIIASYKTAFLFIISLIFAGTTFFLSSCNDKPDIQEPIITNPNKPTTEFISFNLKATNHLSVEKTETNHYKFITQGGDPYILTNGISKSLNKDSVVLTFEYKSSSEINDLQLFFAPPISETRSIKSDGILKTSTWKVCSINLKTMMNELSWGQSGDFLRIDFGTKNGVDLEIRKMFFRSMNENEVNELEKEEGQQRVDAEIEKSIKTYLSQSFPSKITNVKVGIDNILISGQYKGDGEFSLAEILPNDTLTRSSKFINQTKLSTPNFEITIPRFAKNKDIHYDRLLSKWVILKKEGSKDKIDSHARYADDIYSKQKMEKRELKGRKGLGGFSINRGFTQDLDLLGISSVTINVAITEFMYSEPKANTIAYKYGNKTYYFSMDYINNLDKTLRLTSSKDIVVAAIILVQSSRNSKDKEIGKILEHPNFTPSGIYTMPNITTAEGINCYSAALDFLSSRYNRPDNSNGRIDKWIMHNEVDAGLTWTNMGDKPMLVYLDTYIKSMRLCHNITRQYDEHSEVLGSFTHSWAEPVESYSSKEMLINMHKFSSVEGDFQWGIGYHPYPQDLREPKTWNDSKATFSLNSPYVTFKNLEVIDVWIKHSENKFKNSIKRTLWLSENGTNSKSYNAKDLNEQAAGFAYTWKKMKNLDGIDGFQWHNWIDNRSEGGLRIGLRRFPDDEKEPGGAKPVWHAYKAADTDDEDKVFESYKVIVGVKDWSEILQHVSP